MIYWIIILTLFDLLFLGIFRYRNKKIAIQEKTTCNRYIINKNFQILPINEAKNNKMTLSSLIDKIHVEKIKQLIAKETIYWNNFSEDWYFLHPLNTLIELKKIKKKENYEIKILNLERFEISNRLNSLQTAIEQNAATIVITDINGNIEYVNKKFTQLTQYTKEEVIGQNPKVLKSGEQTKEYYENLWSTIKSGKIWKGEFHNKKKDSSLYWESAIITPIIDKEGRINSFVAIKEDITELKQQKQTINDYIVKLENLNQTKDKLFSIVAHDLKNPFSVIKGVIELISSKKEIIQDKTLLKYIDILSRSSEQFNILLTRLLIWSRAQRGKISPQYKKIEISQIFDQQVSIYQDIAKRKGIFIQNTTFPPIFIVSDKEMLATIFRNLINNAVKFSNSGDIIRLNSYILEDKIFMEIKDEGVGMSEEQIHNFQQNNMSSTYGTSNEKGTGIGLSLVNEFAKILKLKIKIKSTKNEGTTFILSYNPMEFKNLKTDKAN